MIHQINVKVLQLVLDIMEDKNDFDNIFKKLKAEFKGDKK